jgi:hypothetical protein
MWWTARKVLVWLLRFVVSVYPKKAICFSGAFVGLPYLPYYQSNAFYHHLLLQPNFIISMLLTLIMKKKRLGEVYLHTKRGVI